MKMTALLVVDKDFTTTHVGVRSVTLHYWRQLLRAGYSVSIATPSAGRLLLGRTPELQAVELSSDSRADAPTWISEGGELSPLDRPAEHLAKPVVWLEQETSPDRFDVSIVTNPWLCAEGMPDVYFSAGIVHDVVPNLLASSALNLGTVIDIYRFAHAHDVGYRAYLSRAKMILCGSESARSDFKMFYGVKGAAADRVRILTAFDPPAGARVRPARRAPGERRRILMVNALDPRKNYHGSLKALQILSREHAFDIDLVGRERMPFPRVKSFLHELSGLGARVSWYRTASPACLQRLYANADVLLFPSLYEGLGLPILEAQAQGQPVVTSNVSSCGEINLNPELAVDPHDAFALAGALACALSDTSSLLRGRPMAEALAAFVKERNSLPLDWTRR